MSLPRSHPFRVIRVLSLAITRLERYNRLKDLDDLEQSILRFTEAILLPLPSGRLCWNIFFSITLALVHRAYEFRQPRDVTRSVIHLRYLRGQPPEAFNVRPNSVKALLSDALGLQAIMKLGDVRQDIEEMAILCHELLKSDISTTSATHFVMNLAEVVKTQLGRLNELQGPSDKVIECLREANIRLPDSYHVSMALAWSLFDRFRVTHSNDDYEEATTILDKFIRAPGEKLTQNQEQASTSATVFALARSHMFRKPEYLEQAIHRSRTLLAELPPEHSNRSSVMNALADLQRDRLDGSGVASGLEETHLRNLGVSDHPSFKDLTASLAELNTGSELERKHFYALFSIDRITDGAEVEGAIEYCRHLFASSHHGSEFAYLVVKKLCELLHRAFSCTNKIEHLDEAISVLRYTRDNFNTRLGSTPGTKIPVIGELISCLSIRLNLLHLRDDFNEIMQLYAMAVNDERGNAPDQFLLSCEWARIAHDFGHPCALAAYDSAISLMQDSLTFSPTLDVQHFRLVARRDEYESLPLNCASYHVSTGQLCRAIETLERGRALIWSEMRGLRTSTDQIRAIDYELAVKFAAVNRDLELLTLTTSSNNNDNNRDDGTVGMDPFGRLVVRQRELLDYRKTLISQIQALPGFETFFKSPSFDNLRSAAARGPVIIINHSTMRSDIIILHHDFHPSLIPTAPDFYHRATNLRDQLLGARKDGLDSSEYEEALSFVLKELYELVGRPVIQRLNELSVPEQSRIWWCPTSVFCSLPLHAMGPIPPYDGRPRYFLDLYIPSYTPTLSTLIESSNPGSHGFDKPSIVLIAQPDASLPEAFEEIQVVQDTDTHVTTLISAMATRTAVLERLRDHKFAHFVCHGILEQGKPFDASFKLYKDKLSLLDIVRSRLPDAEFAFLAACHTAALTEKSIADEVLHLTAAMQYCGFRSVVGTMWEMADIDGRDLAENFYKRVFSSKKQGVRYYERTAKALRDSVKNLRRKKGITLERWVNFVHYGA